MEDADDLQEYMFSLLDGADPAVRTFIPRLIEKWSTLGGKTIPDVKVS